MSFRVPKLDLYTRGVSRCLEKSRTARPAFPEKISSLRLTGPGREVYSGTDHGSFPGALAPQALFVH